MRVVPYVEMRRSYAAPWARRSALLSASILAVTLGAHWFGLLDTPGFFNALACAAGLAVVSLVLSAIGMPKIWYRGFRGGGDVAMAIPVAALVLLPFAAAALWAVTHAPLTDISTDLEDPPVFDHLLAQRGADMNALSVADATWRSEQLEAFPNVKGRRYEVPIENVREALERVFDTRGWTMQGPYLVGTPDVFSMEATVASPVLALPSDVVVRLSAEGDATLVDMRAAARYGSVDFGQNAELIVGFLNELDVVMAARLPGAQASQPSE